MNTLNRKLMTALCALALTTQVQSAWYSFDFSGITSKISMPSLSMPSMPESITSRLTAGNGVIAAGVAAGVAITYALYLKNEAVKAEVVEAETTKAGEVQAEADKAAKVVVDIAKAVEVLKTSKTVDASPEAVAQADAILAEARKIQAGSRQAMNFARMSELHKQAALNANILSGVQKGTLGL